MKKILLILCLIYATVSADDLPKRAARKWQGFIGIGGGVGVFGVFPAFLLSVNPALSPRGLPFGLGYSIGLSGGWQKYTKEKIGMRHTLGFTFSYIPDLGSVQKGLGDNCLFCTNKEATNFKGVRGEVYNFYYAFDGFFDFVENHRFGMILGVGTGIAGTSGGHGLHGFLLQYTIRTGFYSMFEHSILDMTLSFPVMGAGGGDIIYDSPLMFGYKYLF